MLHHSKARSRKRVKGFTFISIGLFMGMLLFGPVMPLRAQNGPNAATSASSASAPVSASVAPLLPVASSPSAAAVFAPVSAPVVPLLPGAALNMAQAVPNGNNESAPKSLVPKDSIEILKEAIAASNKTIDHVSTVFQGFGWWIGVLATLITTAGGFLTWFTFKSLSEARAEHRKHLAAHAEEWSEALTALTANATAEMEKISAAAKKHAEAAETSALSAEKFAAEIETSKGVLDQMIKDVDQLRGKLRANVAETTPVTTTGPVAAPVAPVVDELASDTAEVEAALKNKVGEQSATQPPTPPVL